MHLVFQSLDWSADKVQKRYLAVVKGNHGVSDRYRIFEVDRQHRTIREYDVEPETLPYWAVETAHQRQDLAFNKVLIS